MEPRHVITYEGKNIHDVLQQTTSIIALQKLVEQGERPCDQCFILAAKNGSFPLLEKLLELDPTGVNVKDEYGNSILSYFAWKTDKLLHLLKMGANPLVADIEKVLERMILNSRNENEVLEILKMLAPAGALDTVNGVSLLKLLTSKPKIFNQVLELGINPNIPEIHDVMTRLLVLRNGYNNCELVDIFTKLSKSKVTFVDDKGVTLLKYCSDNFLLVKCLIKSGAPLFPYVVEALKTLVSEQYLHGENDMFDVLEMIVKCGHTLVDEEGYSLIKYCKNEVALLYLLRLGADPNVRETHELIGKYSYQNIENMKEIYSILAASGVKLVDEKGCTLIKYNGHDIDMIRYLLKLGASPFHEGINLLYNTFINTQTDPVELLESLIESGFNVMEEDKNGCTFLCVAIEICTENCSPTSLSLVNYLLNYPDILDDQFKLNCKSCYHPQEIILKSSRLRDNELVKLILGSKFKDNHRLVMNVSPYYHHDQTFHPINLSLISYFVSLKNIYHHDTEDMLRDISYLCDHGFGLNNTGVSPLTVALRNEEKCMTMVEFFLENGVNVEQSVITFTDSNSQDWKETLKLPDAAVMAAVRGSPLKIVERLASHVAFPPVALLLVLSSFINNSIKVRWLSRLLQFGRVPHGTKAYRAIRDKVRVMSAVDLEEPRCVPISLEIPDQVGGISSNKRTIFDVAHRSPLTLLELSRTAARMNLANTAANSSTQSLPEIFKSVLPPGLNDSLILDKIQLIRQNEEKWFANELELLESPTSLIFIKSCLKLADEDERVSDFDSDYDVGSDMSGDIDNHVNGFNFARYAEIEHALFFEGFYN